MNNQKLAPNALSISQTDLVKGGSTYPNGKPNGNAEWAKKVYEAAKWGYEHRSQIASAAKGTYNTGKKVVNFVKGWF